MGIKYMKQTIINALKSQPFVVVFVGIGLIVAGIYGLINFIK